jgi:hypothetical protein
MGACSVSSCYAVATASAGSDRRCGADPGDGFAVGELQHPCQELGHGRRAVFPRQIGGVGVGDQLVVDQGEFVADAFEALPHRDLLIGVQLIKPAGFDGRDEFGDVVVELAGLGLDPSEDGATLQTPGAGSKTSA